MKHALTRVLGLTLTALASGAASPPVNVALRSSWPAPPLLAEILETVSLENPDGFFTFLDRLTDPELSVSPSSMTPEATHLTALDIAVSNGLLYEPGSLTAVEMNLALHAATPKIEAFYQHYEDHHNASEGTKCGSWVDWYGEVICDIETLVQLVGVETIDPAVRPSSNASYPRPSILTFDHIYPSPSHTLHRPPRTAILYGSLSSTNFRELHTYLLTLANKRDPHVEYIFRHIPSTVRNGGRNYLSGYGVALDLKKMDYLALDDRYSQPQKTKDESASSSDSDDSDAEGVDPVMALIQSYPEKDITIDANTPLSEDELAVLGQQATQLIASSPAPLRTLTRLSQNFPKYASALARRVSVNMSIVDELHANGLKAQGGVNMIWLNGAVVEEKDASNPFAMLRLLRRERGVMGSLTGQGTLNRSAALEVMTHPTVVAAQRENKLDGVFDASDRLEGEGEVVVWWNDMEKDSRYSKWNPSLFALLRPMYPGQFPNIKRNLFNVVLILDLSSTSALNFLAGPMANILDRNFPFRFGLVPAVETPQARKMARLFYHLRRVYGRKKTHLFIKRISQLIMPPGMTTPEVDWNTVHAAFDDLVAEGEREEREGVVQDLNAVLEGEAPEPAAPLEKVEAYIGRLGASLAASPEGHVFFNGKHFDMNDDFLRGLQTEVNQQMAFLQEKVYGGSLADDTAPEMANYFYDLPTTSKRRNRYIYPSNAAGSLKIVNLPEVSAKSGLRLSPSDYVYPADSASVPLSLYIVADLDSEAGLDLIKQALGSIEINSRTRITFLQNPLDLSSSSPASRLIAQLIVENRLSKASPAELVHALGLDILEAANEDSESQTPLRWQDAMIKLTGGVELKDFNDDKYAEYVRQSRLFARDLQIAPGESVLVVNGRVVGPIQPGEFRSADFKALEEYEFRRRTEPVVEALKDVDPAAAESDRASFADLVATASSIISAAQLPDPSELGLFDAPQRPRQRNYQLLDSEYTAFEYGDNSTALYHVAVLVDPLSATAQKWSSMLQWLSNIPDIFIEIHLNPARYPEIPLKQFYQYNLQPSLVFDNNGMEVPAQAVFKDLPIDPIYTLAMDVPSSWLVRPREALYDLDNIQLGNLSPGDTSVEAVFDLDYLVVEGHTREVATHGAPRGVQLELITGDGTPIDDTLVMANLGYLQFKAKPGVFKLQIREGRGRDIFVMESVGNEGWDSPSVQDVGSEVTVTSFEGLTLYPRLLRLPGMEIADVLEGEEELDSNNLFEDVASRVMSFFGSKKDTSTDVVPINQQADINIFTVASGLLYERFVSIMILSVLRNTNSSVKFWFIENFLSPSFLEFIPHMASKYNFQYELVTYKWPSWLRAQTEKQRIIWAYKILFLDVLFPMDLKKVIFVDADQIVRADLKELVDLDLHGAPYGYTPMGDDNYEMEGFRFWKTGYWKDFLNGKPYHISALYVIDLVKFRQMAAGDILRGQYQQLSADPNSLANLDQDLPNNLQNQVPIFSLGEDWLWCETWCSKDRLHRAKTIDLCQNPLTKEPKLARARQIPEWEEYDSEISRFARQLAEEGKIHSRMATADANVLASAGGSGAASPSSSNSEGEETSENDEDVVPKRDEL